MHDAPGVYTEDIWYMHNIDLRAKPSDHLGPGPLGGIAAGGNDMPGTPGTPPYGRPGTPKGTPGNMPGSTPGMRPDDDSW